MKQATKTAMQVGRQIGTQIATKSGGFTLLEVMFSLSLFSIILSGLIPAFITQMRFNSASQIRSEGMQAAVEVLDELRMDDPADMPTAGASTTDSVTIGARTFQVTTVYCGDMTYCNSTNNRSIEVSVTYDNEQVYEVETVFTQLR